MACTASWRQSHAQAYLTGPTTNAEPHHKSDAVPVTSQIQITTPSQAPPNPTPEPARHTTVLSHDGKVALSHTLRSQPEHSPSTIRSGGKLAGGTVKDPAGTAKESVEPANPLKASASMLTKSGGGCGGEHAVAISAHSEKLVGVSESDPDPCITDGGSGTVLGGQASQNRVKAADVPEERRAVSTNEGRPAVGPSVDSGRKRRIFEEPSTANVSDGEAVSMLPHRKSGGGGGPEGTRSEHADAKLAKRRPSERASFSFLGAVPHRPRRMRASTGSVSTRSPLNGICRAVEGKGSVGPRFCEVPLVEPSLLPANAQDDRKRRSSPGEGSGRRTIPSATAASVLQPGACFQQTGVCTPSDVTQAHQPRPPEVVSSPPRETTISSVKSKPESLLDSMAVAAPPWMGHVGDFPSSQEKSERPRHAAPSVSTVEESKQSLIRCQGAKESGGRVEDAAMAGIRSILSSEQ